jgi:hypothetical protein
MTEVLDVPDPGRGKPRGDVSWKIEQGVTCARCRREEALVLCFHRPECRYEFRTDLIARLADHGPERGDDARAIGAAFLHCSDCRFKDAVCSATPACMRHPDDGRLSVGEKNRTAIRGGNSDGETRLFGDEGIGAGTLRQRPGPIDDHDLGRMYLVGGKKVLGPNAQTGSHAGAVLRHVVRLIMGPDAAIKARVNTGRYAAGAGKKSMPDAGQPGDRARLKRHVAQDHLTLVPTSFLFAVAPPHGSKPGRDWMFWAEKAITLISPPIPVRSSSVRRSSAALIVLA